MRSAVVFGAGSIGRGFVGALLSQAGWKVTFVDVVESLVVRLNADGGFNQIIVDDDGEQVVRIGNIDALLLSDVEAVTQAVVAADLVATAVGAQNLDPVAAVLAPSLADRARLGQPPLNVLVCENLHDAPGVVRELIAGRVGLDLASRVGLIATSIGRMVPTPDPTSADPTAVRVEPYCFLPYDANAVRGSLPDVADLVPIGDGFAMFADRKMHVHNMGHCLVAHLAVIRGHEYIWQAMEDGDIRWVVRSAMVEAAAAVATVHEVPVGPLLDHVDDLLVRFGNRSLADTVERVGRDPLRKMSPGDRLLGSWALCRRAGVTPSYISVAVAAGALQLSLVGGWNDARVLEFVDDHLFREDPQPELRSLLHRQLLSLQEGLDVGELVEMIALSYRDRRIL